jgi:hypothetical protein
MQYQKRTRRMTTRREPSVAITAMAGVERSSPFCSWDWAVVDVVVVVGRVDVDV